MDKKKGLLIKILIVDDDGVVADILRDLIADDPEMTRKDPLMSAMMV